MPVNTPRAFLAATCGGLVLAAGLAGRKSAAAPAPPPAPQVSVVTVHPGSVPLALELPGRTSPYLAAQVRARVDGIILRRDFAEGSAVKAGQRLFQIDPAPYAAQLASAEAALAKAQANFESLKAQVERYAPLVAANAVSRQDYDNAVAARDQAEADIATARAAIQVARINLGYTAVTSPIAGRSGISQVTQGAYVQASTATLLTTVQQIDPMYVDLTQSSVQGLQLRRDAASGRLAASGPGQATVSLTLEDARPYPLKGKLQFSDITVDPTTGAVTVRAIFPNPDGTLLPGMFVRASIDAGNVANVFRVPQPGVTHDAKGGATALVVGADGKVASRALQLRGTYGTDWIVESGLQDGDRVIVAGLQKVKPGDVAQAAEAKADDNLASAR